MENLIKIFILLMKHIDITSVKWESYYLKKYDIKIN